MRRLVALATSVVFAASMAGGAVAAPLSTVAHAPRISLPTPKTGNGHGNGHSHGGHGGGGGYGWASSNWSGYAVTGSGFTSVTGSWTVPSVAPSRGNTYSASWVGIDGFNNSSLIQTGTGQDYVSGRATYYAWWEILPAAETQITTFAVQPGDQMSATISKGAGSTWTIAISDARNGGSFSTTQSYSGPGTSAEWIEEAPTVGGRIATLANYGATTFDPGTVNGGNPGLTISDGGVMIQNRVQVSTPSRPDNDTDGFNMAYGSTAPSPPGS